MTDLVYSLKERARIRRQIPTRKSVQEGKPDRIADLLEQAADEIERLEKERDEHLRSWNMVCKQLAESQARENALWNTLYATQNGGGMK